MKVGIGYQHKNRLLYFTKIKKMEKFRKGDFIRIKDLFKYKINRLRDNGINIFEILTIESNYVEVKACNEKIPINEIEPILINGIDDFKIYYDPIIAASFVLPGEPTPFRRIDKSYYFNTFKSWTSESYQNKTYQELIKEKDFKYMHEVQHFLIDEFAGDKGLKIDAI